MTADNSKIVCTDKAEKEINKLLNYEHKIFNSSDENRGGKDKAEAKSGTDQKATGFEKTILVFALIWCNSI